MKPKTQPTNSAWKQSEIFLKKINSSDGIIISVGILTLVVGVLVDVFFIRLICLFIIASSALLLYALSKVKRTDRELIKTTVPSRQEPVKEKKLFFDDFESITVHRPGRREDVNPVSGNELQGELKHSKLPEVSQNNSRVSILRKDASPPIAHEFQMADFFDIDSEIYCGDPEPRTEFNFLLHKVLLVVKDVVFANSVIFLWANREKKQMVLEARVSDATNFILARRYTMGHDLASRVAETGKPEIVTEVNPTSENELFPYYESPKGIRSFVGVPVFFTRVHHERIPLPPVAVIAIDSKMADAFGHETLALLGQCTKLISALIKSYTDKYDLLLDSELLRSIRRLQEQVRARFSLETILQSLCNETSKLVSWDHISIVLFEEEKQAWLVKKVFSRSSEGYIPQEQIIEFPESVVGHAIRKNTHGTVDDLEVSESPRFCTSETMEKRGSFIAVPLSSLSKCYGSLNVECREKYSFSRQDIEMLYRLAENAAFALEILYLEEVINEYIIVDDTTGLYSRKFFVQRLSEELSRSGDQGAHLSLVFLTIDKSTELVQRYGIEGFERVLLTLSRVVRQSVRPYDLISRYDSSRFAIALVDTATNDAFLWAEKIRKSVAGHVISVEEKSFSVTISVGVSGALDGMRHEELLNNTTNVLHRAVEAGGNAVRVY